MKASLINLKKPLIESKNLKKAIRLNLFFNQKL